MHSSRAVVRVLAFFSELCVGCGCGLSAEGRLENTHNTDPPTEYCNWNIDLGRVGVIKFTLQRSGMFSLLAQPDTQLPCFMDIKAC